MNNKSNIEDAYQILIAVANQDVGRKQMIEHGTVLILCNICRNLHLGYQKAFHLLDLLLHYSGEEIWQINSECLNQLISTMASQFKQFQDERKFELCTHLTSCLASSYDWVSKTHAVWPWEIHQGLSDILRSKLGQDQRNPAIKLASLMVYQLGVTWALGPNGEDKVLVLLLINLACVEVRMGLEDSSENPTNADVLPACYSILETCIEYMTCSPTMSLDQKQVLQLHNAMTGAFGAIIFFLKEHQFTPEKVDDPLIRATVRVLSVWLAEETSALKSQVHEVLPFVLSVVEKSFEDVQKMSDSSNEPSRTSLSPYPLPSSSAASMDLLRLFLPALCHLTAEQDGRDMMLAHGVMETCGKYFSYQWEQLMENKGEEPQVALITLCNIFLNVSLQDADAVRGAEVFVELYGLIVNVLPTLAKQLQNLVLFFNMAVLGLSLLKNLSNVPSVQELSQNKRCIGSVIEQFANSHQCGKSGQCEVTPTHQQHWKDITELWMLGMQLLIECVPVFPWLPNLFLQCGWINSAVNMLQNVRGGGIDEKTSSMYSALLCTLGHHSSDVHSQLTKVNGLKLARRRRAGNATPSVVSAEFGAGNAYATNPSASVPVGTDCLQPGVHSAVRQGTLPHTLGDHVIPRASCQRFWTLPLAEKTIMQMSQPSLRPAPLPSYSPVEPEETNTLHAITPSVIQRVANEPGLSCKPEEADEQGQLDLRFDLVSLARIQACSLSSDVCDFWDKSWSASQKFSSFPAKSSVQFSNIFKTFDF